MPVEGPLGTQPGWSLSVQSRHSVTHTIKKRISMKYQAKNITREKDYSFSITKSHAKLIHHFLIKYLTKVYASLPVHEQGENPSDTDEEYEQRVKEHY